MKRILPLFIILVLSIGAKAQITLSPDSAIFDCITYGDQDLHLDVVNDSGSDIKVSWIVLDVLLPTGWEITQFCDNISCLSPVVIGGSNESDVIGSGMAMDLKATYRLNEDAVEGKGILIVGLSSGAHSNTAVYMGSTCGPLSVTEFDSESFAVHYENSHLSIFKGHQSSSKSYSIYNSYGQVVKSGSLDQLRTEVEFDYAPSIYIVEVVDDQGNRVGIEKFSTL